MADGKMRERSGHETDEGDVPAAFFRREHTMLAEKSAKVARAKIVSLSNLLLISVVHHEMAREKCRLHSALILQL
jgi:hypothetical protein